jgi:hypothetical protein
MKRCGLLTVLSFAVFLFAMPRPAALVKILKGPAGLIDILKADQTEVLIELGTCYLAKADRDERSALREAGLSVAVLDRDSRGRGYVLVRLGSPDKLGVVSGLGRVLPIEGNLYLFSTDGGDPMAALPSGIEKKPLPRSSILAFLRSSAYPEGASFRPAVNDIIDALVGEVSEASLRAHVLSLQSFETRFTSTAGCEAAGEFILDYFQSIGLAARFQPFTFGSGTATRNVVADIRGQTDPDEIVIICGHYDSFSSEPEVFAPGADDNASGTAAVMEAARILAGHPLDFTVRFIAFSAEEWGLYGSGFYSEEARADGERIIAVLNLDMIGYVDEVPEDLDIIVNDFSRWLADRAELAAATYTGLPVRKIVDASFVYSDHSPFWDRGYSAFCGIEDAAVPNPYYHTTGDTADTLNFDFFRNAAGTALAAAADLAQPVRPGYPRTPAGLNAESEAYASVFAAIKNVRLTWQAAGGAAGYNVYRSGFSHVGFVKINSTPLSSPGFVDRALAAGGAFYYVVTAVSPAGLESSFSREVESPPVPTRYNQSALGEILPAVGKWGWS